MEVTFDLTKAELEATLGALEQARDSARQGADCYSVTPKGEAYRITADRLASAIAKIRGLRLDENGTAQ